MNDDSSIDPTRRRAVFGALGLGLGGYFVGRPARAADGYLQQPITLIVSLQAGSASDLAGRLLADRLGPALGTSVTVANLPGAGGVLGATKVFNARPDGYVLGAFNNGLLCVIPNLPRGQPVDVPTLVPVAMMANLPSVLVVPASVPANTLREFVERSKSSPGKYSYGSVGPGSPQHIAMEMLKASTGADLLHVPYRGGPQAVADVVAGQIQATWIAISVALGFIRSGQLRGLAIGGGKRSPVLPDVPLLREEGVIDFEYLPWVGICAPPGTPAALAAQLNAAIQKILREDEVTGKLLAAGLVAWPMGIDEFQQRIASERLAMADVVRRLQLS